LLSEPLNQIVLSKTHEQFEETTPMNTYPGFQEHRLFERFPFFVGRLPADLEARARTNFEALWNLHPEKSNEILIHGRMVPIPRWLQAYGRDYRFSGTMNQALPVPEILAVFLAWVREAVDTRFNGLLLNWYDAERSHYIGAHRDSRQGLVSGTPIVTISIGEARTFRLRLPKVTGFIDFDATHGTCFVMPWETNLAVKHEVPHSAQAKGRRISITARAFTEHAP
jgi:alkylated DNA repair dioxygenase AlkB